MRFYCIVAVPMANTAQRVHGAAAADRRIKLFQGDDCDRSLRLRRGILQPAGDNMVAPKATQRPEDFAQWGRIARELAKAGMPINAHTTLEDTIDGLLTRSSRSTRIIPCAICAGR